MSKGILLIELLGGNVTLTRSFENRVDVIRFLVADGPKVHSCNDRISTEELLELLEHARNVEEVLAGLRKSLQDLVSMEAANLLCECGHSFRYHSRHGPMYSCPAPCPCLRFNPKET